MRTHMLDKRPLRAQGCWLRSAGQLMTRRLRLLLITTTGQRWCVWGNPPTPPRLPRSLWLMALLEPCRAWGMV
eukprot:12236533-Prorocentrum_lima.AAC.1